MLLALLDFGRALAHLSIYRNYQTFSQTTLANLTSMAGN